MADETDRAVGPTDDAAVPAWRRHTVAEQRWPAALAVLVVIGLQISLPDHLNLSSRYLLPIIELALLVVLVAANPRRMESTSAPLRLCGLALIALASLANAYSAVRIVIDIVTSSSRAGAGELLLSGATVYLTNVIIFGLWYWELDRGGPVDRACGVAQYPDLLFPQMTSPPELSPPEWEPRLIDYLYVAYTNATAFSPTDTMPMTRWAKAAMALQSAVALITVAMVLARAINILK
ncbi:hypothetical protein [Williamsia sterculiae]|uniref:Uncharacterized membrane protein n=1 Tax=Williamsia sterculiae TaxID=1344003 RepID=A0A1N7DL24_9NOCA|nr:hypothetical protein [Williamsia sterculiae]SIR76579.1 Uncharacterized membrane protein [Williamsia sterculiae]